MKKISVFLVFILMFSFTTSTFAVSGANPVQDVKALKLEWDKGFNNITEERLDFEYYAEDEIFSIPEEYLDPYHPEALIQLIIHMEIQKMEKLKLMLLPEQQVFILFQVLDK